MFSSSSSVAESGENSLVVRVATTTGSLEVNDRTQCRDQTATTAAAVEKHSIVGVLPSSGHQVTRPLTAYYGEACKFLLTFDALML
jgi:hypothetical protein